MAQISVSQLRDFQAKLNRSIDDYVAIAESDTQDDTTQKQKDGALQGISQLISGMMRPIKNPFQDLAETGFQPVVNVALRIAVDLDLFNLIDESTTLDSLVQKTGAERQLIFRLVRLLVTVNVFEEKQEKVYSSTPFSRAVRLPPFRDWIKSCFDSVIPILEETPSWLRQNGFRDISNRTNNPSTSLHNGLQFFDYLAQNPKLEAEFASSMRIQEGLPDETRPQYPFDSSSEAFSKDPDAVYMVDVGGGRGQLLGSLKAKHPSMPGHNVLQDLPSVVAGVSGEDQKKANFRAMAHDFFQPQPIIGAKYYVLRVVLHDWPDHTCIEILRHIRTAMKKGYSKLVVYDKVLPEMNCQNFDVLVDLGMWINCGRERTEREHRELFKQAGFRLSKIVPPLIGNFSAVEGVRDDEDDGGQHVPNGV